MARVFSVLADQTLVNRDTPPITAPPFTLSIWFYCTGDSYGVFGIGKEGDDHFHSLNVNSTGRNGYAMTQRDADWDNIATTSTSFDLNEWNHLSGSWVATNSRIVYLNAGGKGTNANACTNPTIDSIRIGQRPDEYSYSFTGRLAEAAMWNVVLTDTEHYILSRGCSPLMVRPQSLVAYWPLIGRTSPEIDIVGGYDMTLVNAPTVGDHPPVLYPPRALFSHVVATSTTTTVQLDWTDVSENEDGFSIERATDAGAFAEIDTVGAGIETYDNVNVPIGHTYHYRVRATSATLGYSEYSNTADVIV